MSRIDAAVGAVRRLPTAGWICVGVALLNGLTWSLITPLFQVPDEPAHIAYAQYVAEAGKPPTGRTGITHYSAEQRRLLHITRWKAVIHRPQDRVAASVRAHEMLEHSSGDREGQGGVTSATNNPPLYYAGAAIAYHVTPSGNLGDRIHSMRFLSVLLGALTVLFSFLFIRELLPGTPWAWTVGGLVVAFQPLFGFMSGGVNSDNLLFAAAAAVFLGFARAFRQGLTPAVGVWIGAWSAVGLLGKINMIGLAPGIAIGLLLLVLRAPRSERAKAVRGVLLATAVVVVPVGIYMALNSSVWDRGLFFGAAGAPTFHAHNKGPVLPNVLSGSTTFGGALGYLWQFYLPRLPFMHADFTGYPLRDVWFDGFIGRFGWLDYGFPGWVYDLALWLFLGILALAAAELVRRWAAVRARWDELLTFVILTAGVAILPNLNGYIARFSGPSGFEQARYLLPLLPLYGTIIALAVRGAGRRFTVPVGILLVALAIAQSAVAMLLTLTRYYG
jgi:4-amino-4-deoxy-L-arabinose transferase-like glycosyltransferase